MKKGLGIIFFACAAVLFLALGVQAICDPSMKDICYNNFPLSSALGFGAAEICGTCYPCGADDGVCPEDFQDITTGFITNCSSCNDPDCSAIIEGNVYRVPVSTILIPLENAVVKAVPTNPHLNTWEPTTKTNVTGGYSLIIPSGRVIVSASFIGLDTEVKEITVRSRTKTNLSFFLPNASCDENCTNYYGRCNRDCQEINGCAYADYQDGYSRIADLCHERKFDDWVVLNQTGNETTTAHCCRGAEVVVEKTPPLRISGKMKNLITSSIPVLLPNGMPGMIMIAVW